ncbi:MAG: biotin--[acetyl-CoA-carboxylase] ligase [Geobacter sp.]|nr:MAG: biotin--[acetyl-CoA-carboxylase] ligase [Geobacter sp.]
MRHLAGQNLTSIDQRMLEAFRAEGKVVSGEELSTLLNVSRTAIWKHIKALRAFGYNIEALPSQGYRLLSSPDILIPTEIQAGLATSRAGKNIICLPETDSTNLVAFRLAEDGAEEGTVVIADAQSRGKGRLGREWVSPRGVNLYCSVILRPSIPPFSAFHLTFLSAVAVARAVERTASLSTRIKWPNDILVNGRKIAGLLNDMSAETEKINFVILGIGVNLNMRREQFPGDLRHPASSVLLEGGKEVRRISFVHALLAELDFLYDLYLTEGESPIRKEWLDRCRIIGQTVTVSSRDAELTGTVTGVDESGALLIRLPDGREERVLSGDVKIL